MPPTSPKSPKSPPSQAARQFVSPNVSSFRATCHLIHRIHSNADLLLVHLVSAYPARAQLTSQLATYTTSYPPYLAHALSLPTSPFVSTYLAHALSLPTSRCVTHRVPSTSPARCSPCSTPPTSPLAPLSHPHAARPAARH